MITKETIDYILDSGIEHYTPEHLAKHIDLPYLLHHEQFKALLAFSTHRAMATRGNLDRLIQLLFAAVMTGFTLGHEMLRHAQTQIPKKTEVIH